MQKEMIMVPGTIVSVIPVIKDKVTVNKNNKNIGDFFLIVGDDRWNSEPDLSDMNYYCIPMPLCFNVLNKVEDIQNLYKDNFKIAMFHHTEVKSIGLTNLAFEYIDTQSENFKASVPRLYGFTKEEVFIYNIFKNNLLDGRNFDRYPSFDKVTEIPTKKEFKECILVEYLANWVCKEDNAYFIADLNGKKITVQLPIHIFTSSPVCEGKDDNIFAIDINGETIDVVLEKYSIAVSLLPTEDENMWVAYDLVAVKKKK
jgi:hypothetical protein